MTQRSYWLLGIVGVLLVSWLVVAAPWSGGPGLQVVVKHTKTGAGGEPGVLIGFNQAYDVRSVEVHRLVQNEAGVWEQPKFGLEADPVWRMIPRGDETRQLQAFMYGQRPRGMRHDVRPAPLAADGHYRVRIETDQGTGVVDFAGSAEAEPVAEAGTSP